MLNDKPCMLFVYIYIQTYGIDMQPESVVQWLTSDENVGHMSLGKKENFGFGEKHHTRLDVCSGAPCD